VLTLDAPGDKTPLLSIFGGKITTYRRLAEAALEKLAPFFATGIAEKKGWTAEARLPGGDFPQEDYKGLVSQLARDHSGILRPLIARLVRAYGTRATDILKDAKSEQDLGTLFGSNLTQREVQYLIANEWAQTTEDVLWRRSKLGLKMSKSEVTVLDAYMQSEHLKIQRGVELGERTE
jgi:glycerol-3-phosphate dehydrogenase